MTIQEIATKLAAQAYLEANDPARTRARLRSLISHHKKRRALRAAVYNAGIDALLHDAASEARDQFRVLGVSGRESLTERLVAGLSESSRERQNSLQRTLGDIVETAQSWYNYPLSSGCKLGNATKSEIVAYVSVRRTALATEAVRLAFFDAIVAVLPEEGSVVRDVLSEQEIAKLHAQTNACQEVAHA